MTKIYRLFTSLNFLLFVFFQAGRQSLYLRCVLFTLQLLHFSLQMKAPESRNRPVLLVPVSGAQVCFLTFQVVLTICQSYQQLLFSNRATFRCGRLLIIKLLSNNNIQRTKMYCPYTLDTSSMSSEEVDKYTSAPHLYKLIRVKLTSSCSNIAWYGFQRRNIDNSGEIYIQWPNASWCIVSMMRQ